MWLSNVLPHDSVFVFYRFDNSANDVNLHIFKRLPLSIPLQFSCQSLTAIPLLYCPVLGAVACLRLCHSS